MQATIQYIKKELDGLYPETEIQGFIRILFEEICGWSYTEQVLNLNRIIDENRTREFRNAVLRLKNHEPIQYIFGETEFMGLKLKVNPSVLIPRPETEELVRWIIDSVSKKSPRILDVGTGSGCIPLALKSYINDAVVTAIDISEIALETANYNGIKNGLDVNFIRYDILEWEQGHWETFDIIVSNPPYVRDMEKKQMDKNVLEWEPDNALFVSDEDPLIFYRKIVEFAKKYLDNNGLLFFEINEHFGKQMYELMVLKDFTNIELRKDINGKDRMICGQKR